jgi:superfamily II DNA or RNA helicase/diadenosine tetraphosphate (Ap4A) HIT family hydrolase/HKD family nuclease
LSTFCPFCNLPKDQIFLETDSVIGMWDSYPVSLGHALLIPRRHIDNWFEATKEEQQDLIANIDHVKAEIEKDFQPDGYNIGFNTGQAAGQTIFHLHVHIIPRYKGDVSDPTGGIRHVIPDKGKYSVEDAQGNYQTQALNFPPRLTTGPEQPLIHTLRQDIDRAHQVDVAVAFTLRSGVELLFDSFRNLLDREGTLRFLTGDYQDCTDPLALIRLMDLADKAEIRAYETSPGKGFHPKSYICHFPNGDGVAYVGSSNVTRAALRDSVEWNFRVVPTQDRAGFTAVTSAFDDLFYNPATTELSSNWISAYAARRRVPDRSDTTGVKQDPPLDIPTPNEIQAQALDALENTRQLGNTAGLVVLATGIGKTWLAAFDSEQPTFERILFVAHREEILTQALNTFRKIRPDARLGRYTGKEKAKDADVLFASIQTLGKLRHLRNFTRDTFDYIIIDEFHHAAAATYRKLIDYFDPKFLLGLTATPERTDGGDLLGLCQENLVFRCDLPDGIEKGLLSPFHYFGVPDNVDYANIKWRSSRFDPDELDNALATQARAQNAYEQYQKRGGEKTLAFCCSKRHADFTANFFRKKGLRCVAVHSGESSAPRTDSLEQLETGDLDIVCAVDMFNEGVDVPSIDTVMMLRPTESAILWTQQIGRGLRKVEGKSHLAIIDYIGNHKIFLNKPRTLLGLGARENVLLAVEQVQAGTWELPPGCEVTYDLETIEILRQLAPPTPAATALQAYYEDFRDRHDQRPTALETFHDSYNPRQNGKASWLDFVNTMGDLDTSQKDAFIQAGDFLASLESTPMSKSYKMVTLLAMLNEDCFPGEVSISQLLQAVKKLVSRSSVLQADFGAAWNQENSLRTLLENNPITAWTGGKGTGGISYFRYEDGMFRSTIPFEDGLRGSIQELTREMADWRLAEYIHRSAQTDNGEIECKIIHASGKPIIKLPDGEARAKLPSGWVKLKANDDFYEANFVKIALNVLRKDEASANTLASILRTWFGPDVGKPGTRFSIKFSKDEDSWQMEPVGVIDPSNGPKIWRRNSREQIPPLFGLEFNTGSWNQGFVRKDPNLFLLVTLEKGDLNEEHKYSDYFIDDTTFHWQSQNRTTKNSEAGQLIKHHASKGIGVHLFVRKTKKERGRAAPFVYCGPVGFQSWKGNSPISVIWSLEQSVPANLIASWKLED